MFLFFKRVLASENEHFGCGRNIFVSICHIWTILQIKVFTGSFCQLNCTITIIIICSPPGPGSLPHTSQSPSSNTQKSENLTKQATTGHHSDLISVHYYREPKNPRGISRGGLDLGSQDSCSWSLKVNIDWWIRIAMTNGYFIFNMSGSAYNACIHCVWWKDIIHSMHIQHTIHTHLVLPSHNRVYKHSIDNFVPSILNW